MYPIVDTIDKAEIETIVNANFLLNAKVNNKVDPINAKPVPA